MISRRTWLFGCAGALRGDARESYVRVSAADPRYFELSNGSLFIPNGLNICWERFLTDERAVLAKTEERYRLLAANGGNFTRLWLGSPFYDLEPRRAGEYELEHARRLDELLARAARHGIRVKLCIEHFRSLDPIPPPFPGSVSMSREQFSRARGGPFADMTEYLASGAGRAAFLKKLDFYAARHASNPTVFGWELWNEMNAVRAQGWVEWTRAMLPEAKRRFPRHLVMQSLGSFDTESKRAMYREVMTMPGNEVAQAHRYLDEGAPWDVCQGPMDVLCASAVNELRAQGGGRPVLLSETGAVEPRHAGPWRLYDKDTAGSLMHDMLFAPFFAGAAGPGQPWHWGFYVEKSNLWHHFRRFNEAVKGIDPRREQFQVSQQEEQECRVYVLGGQHTWTAWVRDAGSHWRSEIEEGREPETRRGVRLAAPPAASYRVYDPWRGRWSRVKPERGVVALPPFQRSLVVRAEGVRP